MDEEKNMRFAHCDGQTDACFDESGRYIISCGADGEVRIWDGFDDDSPIAHHIADVAYSVVVKGNKFYVSVDNNSVMAYTFPKGECEGVISRFTDTVHHIDCNESSKYLAMGGGDFKIKVAELGNDFCKTYVGHEAPLLSVAIDPADKYMASSSCDGSVRVWDIISGDCVNVWNLLPKSNDYHASKTLARMSWYPSDGKYLAVPVKNSIEVYERDTWKIRTVLKDQSLTENIFIASFSNCGKFLAASSYDGKIVVWNFKSEEIICKTKHLQSLGICCLAWNPKKTHLLYADNQGQFFVIDDITSATKDKADDVKTKEDTFKDEDLDALFDDDSFGDTLNATVAPKKKISRIEDDDDDSNAIDIGAIKATYEPKIFGSQVDKDSDEKEKAPVEKTKEIIIQKVPLNVQQSAFQSSCTPTFYHHRYMLWNSVGIVCCYNTEEENSIDVEFHDTSVHHSIHLPNSSNHTMAALSEDGLVLACPIEKDKPSKVVCTNFQSWDSNQEWSVEMPETEEIQAIALGKNFVVCVTNKYYVRLFSIGGLQLGVFSIPGPIVCASGFDKSLILAYHHSAGLENSQDLGLLSFSFDKGKLIQKSRQSISLSPKSTLTWLGFTDEGTTCVVDSVGVIRLFLNSLWTPILDTKENIKGQSDSCFVIGLSELTQQVRCIICKGSRYPVTLPRPSLAVLPFKMPFCDAAKDKGRLEEEYCRYRHLNTLLENLLKEEFEVDNEYDTCKRKIVDNLMRLFALSARSEGKEYMALEIANLMPTSRVVQGAIQYAMQRRCIALAEKLGEVAYHKQEEENGNSTPLEDLAEEEPVDEMITPVLSLSNSRLSISKEDSLTIRPKPLSCIPSRKRSSLLNLLANEDSMDVTASNDESQESSQKDENIESEENIEKEEESQELENQEKSTPVVKKKNPFQVMSQRKISTGGLDSILQSSIDNKKSPKDTTVSEPKKLLKSKNIKTTSQQNTKKRKADKASEDNAQAPTKKTSNAANEKELSSKTTNKISSFLFKKD